MGYKKNGFTLVEVLAVIAVLALLLVLIVPKIEDSLNESEKSTVINSANAIVKAAKVFSLNNGYNKEINMTDGLLDINSNPELGFITIDEENEEASFYMYLDGYCVTKAYYDDIKVIETDKSNCSSESIIANSNLIKVTDNTVTTNSNGESLKYFKLYGNTTQANSNVTLDNPSPLKSLGKYNSETGKYDIDIKIVGKNLFNKENYKTLSNYVDTGAPYVYSPINLNSNSQYKVSIKRYNGYDGRGKGYLLLSPSMAINDNWTAIAHNGRPDYSMTNFQYTTGSDGTMYIGYNRDASQSTLNYIWDNTDVQIEEGNTTTDFEEYQELTKTISLDEPLRCIGTVCDYIDFETNKIVRKVGEIKLDGFKDSSNWVRWDGSVTANSIGVFYRNSDILGVYQNPKFKDVGVSSHFIVSNSAVHLQDDSVIGKIYMAPLSSPPYIGFKVPFTTLDSWKQWLKDQYAAGTPLQVYYELKDYDEKPFDQKVSTLNGINNISVSDGETSTKVEILAK